MGAKKTADCRRLVIVTASIAVVIVVGLTITVWNILTTSDTAIDGFGVFLLAASGCLAALFATVSLLSWYVASYCDPADSHTIASLAIQLIMWLILSRRGRAALSRLTASSRTLPTSQTKLLLDVVRRNETTMFGRTNRFETIKSRADYIATVPLSTYAGYSTYVDKIIANDDGATGRGFTGVELSVKVSGCEKTSSSSSTEKESCADAVSGVLTTDKVEYLACSAGTSGKNKIVPVTSVSKTLAAHLVGPLSFHIAERAVSGSRPYMQRVLNLSYKAPVGRLSSSGLSIGPISAYIGRRMPHVVSPPEVYENVTDEPTALHIHAVFGLAEREIGHIEALFSTLVYSFWKHVERHWPTICDQIESGRLTACFETDKRFPPHHCRYTDVTFSSPSSARTSATLNAVSKYLRPDPERAAQLRREFSSAAGFDGIATRIWPGLRAVRMTATGSFAHHASRLADVYMRDIRQLSLIHAASEGFYGVGLGLGSNSATTSSERSSVDNDVLGMKARYTILPTVGFYEFIPVDQLDVSQPITLFAEQVSLGDTYELVYTSQNGLYRYRTGDMIKIVDFFNQCPVYEFLYRVGQTLNVFWEKTPESVLYDAVRKTISGFKGIQLVDYTSTEDIFAPQLAVVGDTLKHYVLFIEIERDMEDVTLTEAEKNMFDTSLRETFELYASCRATGSIGSMRVHQVARGTFGRLKQHAIFISASSISSVASFPECSNPQYKTPKVVREPTCIQLLASSIMRP